jgi:ribosomal protein L7Ae-like RNA K-turn-binding protein
MKAKLNKAEQKNRKYNELLHESRRQHKIIADKQAVIDALEKEKSALLEVSDRF